MTGRHWKEEEKEEEEIIVDYDQSKVMLGKIIQYDVARGNELNITE